MITVVTPLRSQRYVIRNEAIIGFVIDVENAQNVLSVIIEGKGPVKLWSIKDPDKTMKECGDYLKIINDDPKADDYISEETGLTTLLEKIKKQKPTPNPEQIKNALSPDVKALEFGFNKTQGNK